MRPLRLRIEGLTSFADPTEIDFGELQLFAITGPTGAGKSSLVDAILLALFGKVPRVADKYKQLIAHGCEQLAVMFEFEANGARYRVARRIRQTGTTQVQLERVLGEGTESVAGKSRDIEREIERILGIGYDAFTRSVVLPQGQFDAFLRGDPKERRAILVDLLGLSLYERMARLAGERARTLQAEVAAAEALQRQFAALTPESLATAEEEADVADGAVAALQQRTEALEQLRGGALELRQQRARRAEAEAAAATLRDRLAAAERAAVDHDATGRTFAARRTELDGQRAGAKFAPERGAELARAEAAATALVRVLATLPRLEAARTRERDALQKARTALEQAAAALPQLRAMTDERRKVLAEAEADLARERGAHAALHLRMSLRPDAPCPVCEQPVRSVPVGRPIDVAELERAVADARTSLQAAERMAEQTDTARRQAQADVPRREQVLAEAEAHHADAESLRQEALARLQDAGVRAAEPLDATALQRSLQQEAEDLRRRQTAFARAEDGLRALAAEEAAFAARRGELAAAVAALRPQMEAATAQSSAAAAALARVTAAFADALAKSGETLRAPERGADEVDAVARALRERQAERDRAAATARDIRVRAATLRRDLERKEELQRELAARGAAAANARDLAQLLRADRFQDYVLEEAMRMLAEDGSARLRVLSQNRYSLEHDGNEFAVVDHWNADRARSVRTLSGGETFLASLALALALAERIAGLSAGDGGSRSLECLFIDEGFGALDPEALEAAVQALETLHGGHRMVGVVTHLPELAERLPARLRVENTGGKARVVQS